MHSFSFSKLFFLLVFLPGITLAKSSSEKQTYTLVLDSLYSRTTLESPEASLSEAEDPDVAQPEMSRLTAPHYLYIDQYTVLPQELSTRRSYVDYFYSTQKGVQISRLNKFEATSQHCATCCTLIANQDTLDYAQQKKCGAEVLPVIRYTFSKIIYSKDKQMGFLTVRQQQDVNTRMLWLIVVQKKQQAWEIVQMTRTNDADFPSK